MDEDILTPGQVADLFSVDPATVYRWATDGLLVGFKTPSGRWRFYREDVSHFTERVRSGNGSGI